MKAKIIYLFTKVTVAVILFVVLATKVIASDFTNIKILPHSNEEALILVSNFENPVTELSIKDANGDVLYYKENLIGNNKYSKILDFKNIEDGEYKITVSNALVIKELTFNVYNRTFNPIDIEMTGSPNFEVKNEILKLSFLNHSLKNIKFAITEEGSEIFSKKLGTDYSITTGFDITDLPTGNYNAEIIDGNVIYTYTFKK